MAKKMKTHRGLAKRVKRTKSGRLKRKKAYTSHLMARKTKKTRRQNRRPSYVHPSDQQRIDHLV